MDFLLWVMIGMGIAWWYATAYRKKVEKEYEDHLVDKALDLYKKLTIPLKVERANSIYYCYHNETDNFCCQGKDLEEIKENFKARFPEHGSYILQEYLHMFPEAADMIVDDPTDNEIKDKIKERQQRDS